MEEGKFSYSYSAPTEEERKEIESIKSGYAAGEEKKLSKIERLRRLDKKVRRSATGLSVAVGVCGILVFGTGFTMVLQWNQYIWGSIIAVVGAAAMAIAYPVYKAVLKANKRKYGAEILRLSDELLNGNSGE